MKRNGFTLLELLVVVAIMGAMGSMTVAGYRAMRRGMEERSVLQNTNQFLRSANQRAQIDRTPVAVHFWNETLSVADGIPVVVGHAVAVRQSGRITEVQGQRLYDEYGDLRFNRQLLDEDEDGGSGTESSGASSGSEKVGVRLYPMSADETTSRYSLISPYTRIDDNPVTPMLALGPRDNNATGMACIRSYYYQLVDANGVTWKTGDAYGFEFAEITLPYGYVFGQGEGCYSTKPDDPIKGADVRMFMPKTSYTSTSGISPVTVSSIRPGASGAPTAKEVGKLTGDSKTATTSK